MEQCPELVAHKNTIFGADKAELENLLCFVDEEFYLVVDGLDHISREYELHKDLISRSETEIISELLEIHFPDDCYVIISSCHIFTVTLNYLPHLPTFVNFHQVLIGHIQAVRLLLMHLKHIGSRE